MVIFYFCFTENFACRRLNLPNFARGVMPRRFLSIWRRGHFSSQYMTGIFYFILFVLFCRFYLKLFTLRCLIYLRDKLFSDCLLFISINISGNYHTAVSMTLDTVYILQFYNHLFVCTLCLILSFPLILNQQQHAFSFSLWLAISIPHLP